MIDWFLQFDNVAQWLVVSVVFFSTVALLILVLILSSRYKRIARDKRKKRFQQVIERMLFPVLFDGKSVRVVLESKTYKKYFTNKRFAKQTIRSLIQLRKQYSGFLAGQLSKIYLESGLVEYSLNQLKKGSWNHKCEAVRDLSEMQVVETYPAILTLASHPNEVLRLEALMALIRIKGEEAIQDLVHYDGIINDWAQANLIASFRQHAEGRAQAFSSLLQSNNPSICMLGLRMYAEYGEEVPPFPNQRIFPSGRWQAEAQMLIHQNKYRV